MKVIKGDHVIRHRAEGQFNKRFTRTRERFRQTGAAISVCFVALNARSVGAFFHDG